MNRNHEIDPELKKKLAALQQVSTRDAEKARQGRAAFLQEAQKLSSGAVTQPEKRRHTEWMEKIRTFFLIRRKESYPMINLLAALVVVVTLMVGGGSATLAAAQSSQPGDPLYQTKLLSENVQFNMTTDEQTQAQLALTFASRRAEEVQTMLQAGQMPPEDVQARYQEQVEKAIMSAAGLPDEQAAPALAQISVEMRTQEEAMLRLQTGAGSALEPACARIRQMLQEHLGWLDLGLEPLRNQLKEMERNKNRLMMTNTPENLATPAHQNQGTPQSTPAEPTMQPTQSRSNTHEPQPTPQGPRATMTPMATQVCTATPQGPGPQPTIMPTPQGPGPQPTVEPTPQGPGPQPTVEPTPQGPGPQPTVEPTHQGPGPQPTIHPVPGPQGTFSPDK